MPYIRAKTIKGKVYFYLVDGARVDGKVRQRVIAYLGQHSTVEEACRYWIKQVEAAPDAPGRKHAREMVKKLTPYL